jgi:hypothetical protein
MAKLTAPLYSLHASGTIAGALNFTSVNGVAVCRYAKKKIVPIDPKTDKQKFERGYFRNIKSIWKGSEAGYKNEFVKLAESLSMTGANLHVKKYHEARPAEIGNFAVGFSVIGNEI